ncbi:MFS transporter [Desulfolutivibrio sp.]|uniref:MFS transporter n=1 Tax=Desulfolutivibrio sp. TaxID=2773296 RepID=UPI002F96CF8A
MNKKLVSLTLAAFFGTFIADIDVTIVNVALPSIQADVDTTLAELQWIINSYAVCLAAFMLSASGLSNKYGLKKIWMLAIALFTLASFFCAITGNMPLLLIGRSIQGAAGAVIIPGAMSIIFHAFDDATLRAKVVGAWSAFSAIALAIGPSLGGVLVDYVGWPSIFLINIPLGVLAFLLGGWGMSEFAVEKDLRLDVTGQILSIIWLGCMTYAFIEAGHAGILSPEVTVPFATASILFGVFLVFQARSNNPLLPLFLFKKSEFAMPNIASFVLGFSTYSSLFFFSLFFQEAQGVSASQAGFRMMPQFLLTGVVSVFFGWLHIRIGTNRLMVMSYAIIGAAMVMLGFADAGTSYVYTGSMLSVMGVGMGIAVPVTSVCVLNAVEKPRFATASAVMNSLRQGGMAVGIAVLGALLGASAVSHASLQLAEAGIPEAVRHAQVLVFDHVTDAVVPPHCYREAIAYGFQSAMRIAGLACLIISVVLAVYNWKFLELPQYSRKTVR